MSKNLTISATFNTTVTVPTDGEAASAASLETFAQALANRTEWLKANAGILSENESVTGNWTFNNPVTVGAATSDNHAIRRVDAQALATAAENNAKGYADSLSGASKWQLSGNYKGTLSGGSSDWVTSIRVIIPAGKNLRLKRIRGRSGVANAPWLVAVDGVIGTPYDSIDGYVDLAPNHTLVTATGVERTASLIVYITNGSGNPTNTFNGAGVWLELALE